jgi:hypothetical protein
MHQLLYLCVTTDPDRDVGFSCRSSRLYGRFKPRAVQGIMDLVAKCPELNKASTRHTEYVPHSDSIYICFKVSDC